MKYQKSNIKYKKYQSGHPTFNNAAHIPLNSPTILINNINKTQNSKVSKTPLTILTFLSLSLSLMASSFLVKI